MALFLPANYTIDVHTHPIPDFYRQALIDAGYTVKGTELWIDGFITPPFDIHSYLENRAQFNYDYSVMSITAPGTSFLNGNPRAKTLARQLNDQMYKWTQEYPARLGALCCLPLPDIEASLEEMKYCLDELHFDGVGLYTSYNGRYLGDAFLDPIFEELNCRGTTVLVHPVSPTPEVKLTNVSSPAIEYTFDSTRAVTNLLFSGARKRYPNVKMIFSHGGGTVPFLASRIAGLSSLPFQGGRNPVESMAELKGYYYDLAAATSPPQLAALNAFVGPSQLVVGSDFPYFPAQMIPAAQAGLASFSGFTEKDLAAIRHGNALEIFPRIVEKLSQLKKD